MPLGTSAETDAIETALPLLDEPMTFLAIAGFGATGPAGNIRRNTERAAGNDFRAFFRGVGICTMSGRLHA